MIEFGDVEFYLDKDSPGFAPEMNYRGFFEIDDEGQIIEIELLLAKNETTGWREKYFTVTPKHFLWTPLKEHIAAQFYLKINDELDRRVAAARTARNERLGYVRDEHAELRPLVL